MSSTPDSSDPPLASGLARAEPARPAPGRIRRLADHADIVVAALLCSALAVILWSQGGQDDCYITYWAARALAEHGQILNYNGLRLEQSSSLSLVLVLALVYRLTPLSMPTVAYCVSLGAGVATMLLAVRVGRRMGLGSRAGLVAALGTFGCFSYWATSGMETALTTAAGLWFIDECTRATERCRRWYWLRFGAAAFLFAAARPEAPLLLVGLALLSIAIAAVSRRSGSQSVGRALLLPMGRAAVTIAVVGLLFGFRRLYFHAWWPNPALMKVGGFNAQDGARYLWDVGLAAGAFPLLLFIAGLAVLVKRRLQGAGNATAELVASLGLAQLAFLVSSGGDWMQGARFLALIVPSLVLTGFLALEKFATAASGRAGLAALYAAANLVFAVQVLHQGAVEGQPLWTMRGVFSRFDARVKSKQFSRVELLNKMHRRDAVTLSELLPVADALVAQVKTRPIQVMTGQAGMTAYHLASRHFGKVNILDLWSLTDRQLLDCLPKGTVSAGKWGTFIGPDRPLKEHAEISKRCGLPLPDIFYNAVLDDFLLPLFAQLDYVVVYHQVGRIKNSEGQKFFPANEEADGYVAVKRELALAAGLQTKQIWHWDLNPP
ncbi:MAG TPA: hypothetical protein VJ860_10365 [Polyangia bacterium]|jgi:hypothetical protein|nr:hypothetical protein [Polyangia bacterium]